MLFLLYEILRGFFSALNVLRYPSFRVIASMVTSLAITMLLYPWLIRMLRVKQIGEEIRGDGPERHQQKRGTPTMGGSLMVIAILASILLWADLQNYYVLLTAVAMVGFSVIGFIDDRRKLLSRKGLKARTKLLWQFAVALAVCAAFFYVLAPQAGYNLRLYFPFLRIDRYWLELPEWAYMILGAVVIVGTSNGLNLSDGLDGLAILPTITGAAVYLVLAYLGGAAIAGFVLSKYLLIPNVPGVAELSVVAAAVIGAGLGFLWDNCYPASIFMGDVGSLSLGATLGCLSLFTKNEFLSVLILGIFVLEAVSVITQTVSYKLTGKRVFRMAPLHHHFELKGLPEPKIIVRFWIISLLLGLLALASVKVR